MKIWVDAQLSPAIAQWLTATHGVDATAVRDLGLRDAEDSRIFFAARQQDAIVMSKDSDFVDLVLRHGPPPQIIGITCGNTRIPVCKRSSALCGRASFSSSPREKS